MPPLLQILLGLVLLVFGGESLVRGATRLARQLGLSPAVIGLTVVAIGTSVPELVVSVLAAFRGTPDLAVGNVIGSNLFNLTGALGLAALVAPLSVRGQAIRLEWPVLALATLGTLTVLRDAELDRLEGVVLLACLVGFITWMVRLARRDLVPQEVADLHAIVERRSRWWPENQTLVAIGLVAIGVALLMAGGDQVVSGAVVLAQTMGMSERVIGLTIVAVGTGLPEVVTSMVAAWRGESDIAVANMIGSNIMNLLGILGLSAAVHPIRFDPSLAGADAYWLVAITLGIFPILHTGHSITRREGALLVAVYAFYVGMLL